MFAQTDRWWRAAAVAGIFAVYLSTPSVSALESCSSCQWCWHPGEDRWITCCGAAGTGGYSQCLAHEPYEHCDMWHPCAAG